MFIGEDPDANADVCGGDADIGMDIAEGEWTTQLCHVNADVCVWSRSCVTAALVYKVILFGFWLEVFGLRAS
jgi:hypothetical protein